MKNENIENGNLEKWKSWKMKNLKSEKLEKWKSSKVKIFKNKMISKNGCQKMAKILKNIANYKKYF